MLADKGYDADYIVKAAEAMSAAAVIPLKSNRKTFRVYDKEISKERNLIERMFNKIKQFRRVATRYDKLAQSLVCLALFLRYIKIKKCSNFGNLVAI